jgi:hypothetical protein
MLNEIAEKIGFSQNGNKYERDNISVKFTDKEAIVTETLSLDDNANRITALTYAAGELPGSFVATDGKGFFFVPEDMEEHHLRIAVVHLYAPDALIVRPINITRVMYDPAMPDPEEVIARTIERTSKKRFEKPEVKFLGNSGNLYIYLASSFDKTFNTDEKTEHVSVMLAREPVNEMEGAIMAELKKIFLESCPPQSCNTSQHEESRLADLPGV